MRISDWSSDVCSSDLTERGAQPLAARHQLERPGADLLTRAGHADDHALAPTSVRALQRRAHHVDVADALEAVVHAPAGHFPDHRSEEHPSELQSLMRISYAGLCLKKTNTHNQPYCTLDSDNVIRSL